ncbi:RNA-binding protein 39 [Oryzias melastigma]|uniref:RNA-binding protein 39 n=1 Tax=Oryzias melastigma TaxID=30732 RepID=A0A834FER6_ORYME|nr:RNA-binding protein 39 [Oryzias melastigma]
MFNPSSEHTFGWEVDIQRDVIEECNKHGGVVHIYVDKNSSEGNVYVKCPSIPAAMSAVNALHGRFFGGELCHMTAVLFCSNGSTVFTASPVFSGKMITAAYVPLPTYHKLFPESVTATQLLVPPLRR